MMKRLRKILARSLLFLIAGSSCHRHENIEEAEKEFFRGSGTEALYGEVGRKIQSERKMREKMVREELEAKKEKMVFYSVVGTKDLKEKVYLGDKNDDTHNYFVDFLREYDKNLSTKKLERTPKTIREAIMMLANRLVPGIRKLGKEVRKVKMEVADELFNMHDIDIDIGKPRFEQVKSGDEYDGKGIMVELTKGYWTFGVHKTFDGNKTQVYVMFNLE